MSQLPPPAPRNKFRLLPESPKARQNVVERGGVAVTSLAFLGYMALTPGQWGDKATLIQAFASLTLIWATYQSIRRSDAQIEVAQDQMSLSQRQVAIAEQAREAHNLSCRLDRNLHMVFSNLSAMPILVTAVYEGVEGRDGFMSHPDAEGKVLATGESFAVVPDAFLDPEFLTKCKQFADQAITDPLGEPGPNPLKPYSLTVRYRYGGTGGREYDKEYKFGVANNHHKATSSPHWPHEFFIYLTEFHYTLITGVGPHVRLHRIDVPDEELILRGSDLDT